MPGVWFYEATHILLKVAKADGSFAFCRCSGDAFAEGDGGNTIYQRCGNSDLADEMQTSSIRVRLVNGAGLAAEVFQNARKFRNPIQ